MSIGHIDPRFGDPSARPLSWTDVEALLQTAELYWLTTVRDDGRPHVTPLVGVWHDGRFVFCTGADEQKHRNLRSHAEVAVTTGSNRWTSGTDVVVEGTAQRVIGRVALAALAAAYTEKYGDDWTWEVDDHGFLSEGTRAEVFSVHPAKVIVFGKDPHSQTTYRG